MNRNSESLRYAALQLALKDNPRISQQETLSRQQENLYEAMNCNGYFRVFEDGKEQWSFITVATKPFEKAFEGENISFFGPGANSAFFNPSNRNASGMERAERMHTMLDQPAVTFLLDTFSGVDTDVTARISYVLGGIVRHLHEEGREDAYIKRAIEFASQMILKGDEKSADAIACSIARYIISGGSTERNDAFATRIGEMAKAISSDPVALHETADLGRSQRARLQNFLTGKTASEAEISENARVFNGIPTLGLEVHLDPAITQKDNSTIWQRLALLNMSQYQRGSYIQMSRDDRDVLEVRMNPSDFSTAILTWKAMKGLLPELNEAAFTVTVNRTTDNFSWERIEDTSVAQNLQTLAMLRYWTLFGEQLVQISDEEINFGTRYFGQTVRCEDGKFSYDGSWTNSYHDNGQLGIYIGVGDTFEEFGYLLVMGLARPDLLDATLKKHNFSDVQTLSQAGQRQREDIIRCLNDFLKVVQTDETLDYALKTAGKMLN